MKSKYGYRLRIVVVVFITTISTTSTVYSMKSMNIVSQQLLKSTQTHLMYPMINRQYRTTSISCDQYLYHRSPGTRCNTNFIHTTPRSRTITTTTISLYSTSSTTTTLDASEEDGRSVMLSPTITSVSTIGTTSTNDSNNDNTYNSSTNQNFKVVDENESKDDDDDDDIDNRIIRERTMVWIRRIVIGLNLCPFAKLTIQMKQLRLHIIHGNDPLYIIQNIQKEIDLLIISSSEQEQQQQQQKQEQQHTTTIIVCPECYPNDFLQYLNIVHEIEDMIRDNEEYDGIVQLASFHPYYCFDGSNDYTDPDNCTNQSPYPIFHLLREDDISYVVNTHIPNQDSSIIWSRNVDLLNTFYKELTPDEFNTIMKIPPPPLTSSSSSNNKEIGPYNDNDSNNKNKEIGNEMTLQHQQEQEQEQEKSNEQQQSQSVSLVFRVRQILRRFPIKLLKK